MNTLNNNYTLAYNDYDYDYDYDYEVASVWAFIIFFNIFLLLV